MVANAAIADNAITRKSRSSSRYKKENFICSTQYLKLIIFFITSTPSVIHTTQAISMRLPSLI